MLIKLIFLMLLFFVGIYLILIGPLLFRFWIIPKIENKYRATLEFDVSSYVFPFPQWGMPQLEISSYIFFKWMKWNWMRGIENPRRGNFFYALKKINYDVKTASKGEIITSIITTCCLYYIFMATIVILVLEKAGWW